RIHERQIEAMSNSAAYVFFDRGPVDPLSYATYYNFSVHRKIIERVEEILDNSFYQTTVFLIAPLIEDLYENSTIRYEDRETSEKLGNHLATCYRALGFEVLEVPFGTVEARARWILDYIKDDICQPWWNHGRFEPLYAAYK
ncbi:hypothetical protein FJ364_02965, partial [Candidatus Dependentiae bacterium]|nr:hypothetical protein [Candidatus Dependentiae bacterium]